MVDLGLKPIHNLFTLYQLHYILIHLQHAYILDAYHWRSGKI
jgi:hypothetical protein